MFVIKPDGLTREEKDWIIKTLESNGFICIEKGDIRVKPYGKKSTYSPSEPRYLNVKYSPSEPRYGNAKFNPNNPFGPGFPFNDNSGGFGGFGGNFNFS